MRFTILALLLIAGPMCAYDSSGPPRVDLERVTVSGISSGGQMAQQLHIAYSDLFSGAGIIAGGPFGCAEGSLAPAMARCIGKTDGPLPVAELAAGIKAAASDGRVADTANLRDDRVWLFHGALDTVVAAEVSDAAAEIYAEFIPSEQIVRVNDIDAGHNYPAKGRGNACGVTEPPFVSDCGYDAAGAILQYLYPGLNPPADAQVGALQQVTLAGAASASLSDVAYLYTPGVCNEGGQACALHLVLHGCAQSASTVGTLFIEQSGYLPWAASNDLVLAFPQVVPSAANPLGCWDWWGYTGDNYLWRDGAQTRVLADWVKTIAASE